MEVILLYCVFAYLFILAFLLELEAPWYASVLFFIFSPVLMPIAMVIFTGL